MNHPENKLLNTTQATGLLSKLALKSVTVSSLMETVNITGENIRIYLSIAFFSQLSIKLCKQRSFDMTVYWQLTHVLAVFFFFETELPMGGLENLD